MVNMAAEMPFSTHSRCVCVQLPPLAVAAFVLSVTDTGAAHRRAAEHLQRRPDLSLLVLRQTQSRNRQQRSAEPTRTSGAGSPPDTASRHLLGHCRSVSDLSSWHRSGASLPRGVEAVGWSTVSRFFASETSRTRTLTPSRPRMSLESPRSVSGLRAPSWRVALSRGGTSRLAGVVHVHIDTTYAVAEMVGRIKWSVA